MTQKQLIWTLIIILIGAAFMRLWALSEGDPMGDEVLYAFRAVGMLDFDEANEQTTPLEWFDPLVQSSDRVPEAYAIGTGIPQWTRLSFHDHPPLVFLIQHIFMRFFGESTFVFRLPSALFGIASVYLLFLIGRQLFSSEAGLAAAAFGAVNVHLLFVSRLGLQEAYVIFFLLFVSYLFLRSLQKDIYFIWTGVALGCAFLTKYTTFILVPIFLVYLLLYRRDTLFNKKLWIGACVAIILFSPVVVYNIQLYRAVGHFDFQISHVFGQDPTIWQIAPGKEIGTLTSRIKEFLPAFFGANSWFFGVLALTSLFFLRSAFLWLLIGFLAILIVAVIGPSARFLAMLTPALILSAANFLYQQKENVTLNPCRFGILLFVLFVFFEIAYSANSLLVPYPKGPERWAFSPLRYENFRWGYNELSNFLGKELAGKMPALHFDMQYQFLNDKHEKAIKKAKQAKLQPYPALVLYDGNIDSIPQLWILDRLNLYHVWPVIKIETFERLLEEQGEDYFSRSGFQYMYVIIPTERVPWKDEKYLTSYGHVLEEKLKTRGIEPIILQNQRKEEVFRIYRFHV
jgi:hypothetical protein